MKIKFLTRQVLRKLATFDKLTFLIVPILLLNSFTLPIQINNETKIERRSAKNVKINLISINNLVQVQNSNKYLVVNKYLLTSYYSTTRLMKFNQHDKLITSTLKRLINHSLDFMRERLTRLAFRLRSFIAVKHELCIEIITVFSIIQCQ